MNNKISVINKIFGEIIDMTIKLVEAVGEDRGEEYQLKLINDIEEIFERGEKNGTDN